MTSLRTFIEAGQAKAASQESAMLVRAAKNAQGALQWQMAATLWNQAADALPRDPHTGRETLQAQAYRRSASHCQALVNTNAPMRLIKDAPDYEAERKKRLREVEAYQDTFWRQP
jgi:hypothetical protein